MPDSPHTYAGVNAPARLLAADRTPPNRTQKADSAGAAGPHSAAQHNAKCGASGSNPVAIRTPDSVAIPGARTHLRAWLTAFSLSLVLWLLALAAFVHIAEAKCRTKACWKRVHIARAERWLWRHYRAHPMPFCTWAHESGMPRRGYGPYARARYRVKNSSSTAAGKYQALDGTWQAFGGPDYPGSHDAAQAPPLLQERIARRILAGQGINAWSGC